MGKNLGDGFYWGILDFGDIRGSENLGGDIMGVLIGDYFTWKVWRILLWESWVCLLLLFDGVCLIVDYCY